MPAKEKVKDAFMLFGPPKANSIFMEVFINNQPVSLQQSTSLQTFLLQNNLASKKGIAVAVNNKVVPRTGWEAQPINANDKITIIHATQGG